MNQTSYAYSYVQFHKGFTIVLNKNTVAKLTPLEKYNWLDVSALSSHVTELRYLSAR